MTRLFAILLSTLIAFSGVILAGAKGVPVVQGTDIVICSGVNVTTITIGPDGEPIEKVDVCPEGHSIFAAAHVIPEIPAHAPRQIPTASVEQLAVQASRDELTASARGPPQAV